MMADIHLSRLHFPVTALGPGRRIGLWVQGCSIRCEGCISLDTWAPGKGATTVEDVAEAMMRWINQAEGLTISGGEPLEQVDAITTLLKRVRPRLKGDVLLFTGWRSPEALAHPLIQSGLIDVVIPEPYDPAAPQTRSLRGSDNQPLVLLTPLGRDRYAGLANAPPKRVLDVMFDEDGAWFAGIPGPGDFTLFEKALKAHGHRVVLSGDARTFFGYD